MTASCYVSWNNVVPGHAFTLLGAVEETFDGVPVKLIKVRNPWGSEKYTGPYSD